MAAIFGLVGACDPSEMAAVGRRLRHHGARELIWPAGASTLLGRRARDGDAMAPTVPLTLAGRIHNRAEIVTQLGAVATPRSDTELLWELYRSRGVEAFGLVNGQFAVALVDPASDCLVLAVDRWAARPLYFASLGRCGVFASDYRSILAMDGVPARANLGAFDHLQATKHLPAGEGLLADLRPVAPGCWVRLRSDGWETDRYAPLALDVQVHRPEEELVGELKDQLLAAAERLIDGVSPIGLALSAGLDSTVTLGAIRAVAPDLPIHTYTASFHAGDPDLRLAAEAAQHYRTIHREIIIAADQLPRLMTELVWTMEDPVAREEMIVYLVLAREAAGEVPLVLYGQLSDALFAGMPRHLLIKVAGDLPWLRQPILDFYDYTQTGRAPATHLGRLLVSIYYRGRQCPPARVVGASAGAGGKTLALAEFQPVNAAILEALKYPSVVAAMERLHAQVGVEYGSIFHDLDLARFAMRVPDRLKIKGRSRKYILHRAAAQILPSHLAARPKGFVRMPRDRRLLEVVDGLADVLLAPEAVASRGMFSQADVDRLRRRPPTGTYADDQFYHLWTMLLSEIWARTFIDGRADAPITLPSTATCVTAAPAARTASAPGSPMPPCASQATRQATRGPQLAVAPQRAFPCRSGQG